MTVPEGIKRQARLIPRLEAVARQIGDASLDAMHAVEPDQRKEIAQRLRSLADKLENV